MSVSNLELTPGDGTIVASWQLGLIGNAVIAKIRHTGSGQTWSDATAVELSKRATGCTFTGLTNGQSYDVQVNTVTFQSGSAVTSATPQPPTVTVSAAPTGPPVPSGGWHTVLADGFNDAYPLSNLWGPNANNDGGNGLTATIAPENADEVAAFSASQLSLQSDGVHLSARYEKGVGGAGKDYLSACFISQNQISGEPGQQGFPIIGFRFLPTPGVIWALEAMITMPDMSDPGQDPGWWLSTAAWVDEIDMPEMWGYGKKPYGYGMAWIYNTSAGSEEEKTAYGDPIETDGNPHLFTNVFNGVTRMWDVYIDGTHRADLSQPWPSSFSSTPMYLVFSHGMRNDYGTPPTFTTGTKEMVVRSCAAYLNGTGTFTGGGVAPGTVVA